MPSEKPIVEEWRTIADFPDYAVSNWGQVKRVTGGKKGAVAGKIRKPFDNNGYVRFTLRRDGRYHNKLAHALVYAAFVGVVLPDGLEINHDDGDKTHNWPDNLIPTTPSGNIRHAFDVLGRRASRGQAKLTYEQADEIRQRYAAGGCTLSSLATEYGLHFSNIGRIVRREIYNAPKSSQVNPTRLRTNQ